jgi:hypothetical protein
MEPKSQKISMTLFKPILLKTSGIEFCGKIVKGTERII